MFSDALVSQFHRARLDLKVTAAPLINAGNSAIVQLDIARDPQSFLLWKGETHNQIFVQGTDRKLQQLVLFVKEPRRSCSEMPRRHSLSEFSGPIDPGQRNLPRSFAMARGFLRSHLQEDHRKGRVPESLHCSRFPAWNRADLQR